MADKEDPLRIAVIGAGAGLWLLIMTKVRRYTNRGVLIAMVDNLKGCPRFTAINSYKRLEIAESS